MTGFDQARRRVIDRAVHGPGVSAPAARKAAFDGQAADARVAALLEKVRHQAWEIADEDVKAALGAGAREDEVFELVVCAALGQAQRQLEAACRALDRADGHEPPGHGGQGKRAERSGG